MRTGYLPVPLSLTYYATFNVAFTGLLLTRLIAGLKITTSPRLVDTIYKGESDPS